MTENLFQTTKPGDTVFLQTGRSRDYSLQPVTVTKVLPSGIKINIDGREMFFRPDGMERGDIYGNNRLVPNSPETAAQYRRQQSETDARALYREIESRLSLGAGKALTDLTDAELEAIQVSMIQILAILKKV